MSQRLRQLPMTPDRQVTQLRWIGEVPEDSTAPTGHCFETSSMLGNSYLRRTSRPPRRAHTRLFRRRRTARPSTKASSFSCPTTHPRLASATLSSNCRWVRHQWQASARPRQGHLVRRRCSSQPDAADGSGRQGYRSNGPTRSSPAGLRARSKRRTRTGTARCCHARSTAPPCSTPSSPRPACSPSSSADCPSLCLMSRRLLRCKSRRRSDVLDGGVAQRRGELGERRGQADSGAPPTTDRHRPGRRHQDAVAAVLHLLRR